MSAEVRTEKGDNVQEKAIQAGVEPMADAERSQPRFAPQNKATWPQKIHRISLNSYVAMQPGSASFAKLQQPT